MDLLQELDKAILSEKRDHRNYIGASSIGDECSRKIWFRFNGRHEEYSAESIRRFEDGYSVESRIIKWLKNSPSVELWDVDENGEQFGFSALDGRYQGHYDGIIRFDGVTYVLEIKASSKQSALVKLKEKLPEELVLQKWNEDYYAQAMTYCHFAQLDSHLLICADPGGRNLEIVRTPYNQAFAEALIEKARRIADATTMPQKNGGKTYWKCKMCPFYGECWNET